MRSSHYFYIGMFVLSLSMTGCVGHRMLVTPPLYLKNAHIIHCTAVNLNDDPLSIDIKVFDEGGNQRCGVGPSMVAPGHTVAQYCNSDLSLDPQPIRYCVFTYEGEKNKVVGGVQINPPEGEAVPAISIK